MAVEELGPGEIKRTLDRLERTVADALAEFRAGYVPREVWQSENNLIFQRFRALEDDLKDVKSTQEQQRADVSANRRLAVTSFLAPIVVAITVAVIFAAIGMKP